MLALFFALVVSLTEEEQDELILTPAHLSDFVTARQLRNLTVSGKKDLGKIYGQYFRKPMFELLQSTQPTLLQIRQMYFQGFDGMIVKGVARGTAKFADVYIYDCTFNEGNQHAIHIHGPSKREGFDDEIGAEQKSVAD